MLLHLLLFAIVPNAGLCFGALVLVDFYAFAVRRSSTNFMTFLLFIVMITVLFTINMHTSMAQLNHSCMPHKQYALCTYVARSIIVRFSVRVDAVRLCCRLFHIFFLGKFAVFRFGIVCVLLG